MTFTLPPKGPEPPNGDQSQVPALVGMTVTMLILSSIFVILRFITRIWVIKAVKWDDWTILFAFLGTIVGAGVNIPQFQLGFGHHRYYINDEAYVKFTYYSFGRWIQTFSTLMFTKVSICLFLLHIPVTKALRRPLQAAIVILIVSNVALTLMWILQCNPVNAAWNPNVHGKCLSKTTMLHVELTQGVISAISDFVLAAFPILIIYRLNMNVRTKAGLCLLMGLGVITGACCVVRTAMNYQNASADLTWNSVPNWMWRCLEVNFGMSAACLPTLHPGYKYLKRRILSHRSRRSSDDLDTKVLVPVQAFDPSVEPVSPPMAYHPEDSSQLESRGDVPGIRKTTEVNIKSSPRKKRWLNPLMTTPNLESAVNRSLARIEAKNTDPGRDDLV